MYRFLWISLLIFLIFTIVPEKNITFDSQSDRDFTSINNNESDQVPVSETTEPTIIEIATSSPKKESVIEKSQAKKIPDVGTRSASSEPEKIPPIRPPSLSPDVLNEKARLALVNILCEATPPLRSTSGSGAFIDSRGIILTNAHIAQYFLLENSPYSVSCIIRTGSPAVAKWHAKLIFIPQTWIEEHAQDILASRATGTGENDYAFLMITGTTDNSPFPPSFPFVKMNYEEAARITGDPVLVAGYPAEFIGGNAARNSLHASTVFSNIKQLLTFTEGIVDIISVGGTALAQSGSSGGSFVDLFGSLVGLIVTTSIGDTTGARDLHAITPSHIDRSMRQHLGLSTQNFLSQESNTFLSTFEPKYIELSRVLQSALELQRD